MKIRRTTVLLGMIVVLACSSPGEQSGANLAAARQPSEAEVARVRSVASELAADLAGRLFAELEASGPLAAIEVCSRVAQDVARARSTGGLQVRRVSLKVRNAANEPDSWERQRLADLASQEEAGELPEEVISVVETDSGRELRYLKPLRIAPPCLTCHGDRSAMAADLRDRLDELYPDDDATGYLTGDLRGVVSVRLALEHTSTTGGQ